MKEVNLSGMVCFLQWITIALACHFDRQVTILIDEVDRPLMIALTEFLAGEAEYKHFREIKTFFVDFIGLLARGM